MGKSKLARAKDTPLLLDVVDVIRLELNLLRMGYFSAHKANSKDKTTQQIRKFSRIDIRDGKRIESSVVFDAPLGLPTIADMDKWMALLKLIRDSKPPGGVITNPIRFSGYSLMKILGVSPGGANYEDLTAWGRRMNRTAITSARIIYLAKRKQYVDKTVYAFQSFTRVGESDLDGGNATDSYVVELGDWLLASLNEGGTIPEDIKACQLLSRPTAKGIFVQLPAWFYANDYKPFEKDYFELCRLLNIKALTHESEIRRTMGKALDELVSIKYLHSWDVQKMKTTGGFKIILDPGVQIFSLRDHSKTKVFAVPPKVITPSPAIETSSDIHEALIQRGVNANKSKSLCIAYSKEELLDQVEAFDFEMLNGMNKRLSNPPGYLISRIETAQPMPQGFVCRAVRAAHDAKKQEDDRLRADQAARNIEQLEMQMEYATWIKAETESRLQEIFQPAELEARLNGMAKVVDPDVKSRLSRMPQTARREWLLKMLGMEMRDELNLPTLDEWQVTNAQQSLFQ